jgi:Histidine kinase-, DNA gyrase B-, and HSP90-like ATPase
MPAQNMGPLTHGLAIAVTDYGTGMDETTLAQAMEPFFTTKGPQGSGLGLSMVKGFAEQSGGIVQITSTPGEGTTIELRLPLAAPVRQSVQSDLAAPSKTTEMSGQHPVGRRFGRLKIRCNRKRLRHARHEWRRLDRRIINPGLKAVLISGYADARKLLLPSNPAAA